MQNSFKLILLITVFCSMSACVSLPSQESKLIERESGVSTIAVPNSSRVAYFKQQGSTERFCAPRRSDAAITASSSLGLSASVGEGSDSIKDGAQESAVALGGRNPEVLLARELLFRACELSLNINADPATTLDIYKLTLKAIERLAVNNSTTATETTSEVGSDDDSDDE